MGRKTERTVHVICFAFWLLWRCWLASSTQPALVAARVRKEKLSAGCTSLCQQVGRIRSYSSDFLSDLFTGDLLLSKETSSCAQPGTPTLPSSQLIYNQQLRYRKSPRFAGYFRTNLPLENFSKRRHPTFYGPLSLIAKRAVELFDPSRRSD